MKFTKGIVLSSLGILAILPACANKDQVDLPDAPAPGTGFQYRMVSSLSPGQEIERCHFFKVPDEGYYISRDEVRYTPGSHHVLLFKTPYKEIPQKDMQGKVRNTSSVFDCENGAAADWEVNGVLAGAQAALGDPMVNLPEGVGIHVPGGSVVLMNTHYLNASGKDLEADARINVYTIPKEKVKEEGGLLFFYNPFIHIPKMSKASAQMRCPISKEITLANIQSHMHRRGVGYVADWVEADGKRKERLYENTQWEDVPVKKFQPGKVLAKGTAFEYRCDYDNKEDRTVIQGGKSSDEMCMLIGSYYPREPAMEVCQGATFMGTGQKNCAQTALCVSSAQGAEGFYGCVVDSCPEVASQMTAALRCQFSNGNGMCQEACKMDRQSCQMCVQEACKPLLDACFAAKCNP